MTRIHRRALLRGLGGIAIALPALEIMGGSARPAAAAPLSVPKRFVFCYGGMSIGNYVSPTESKDMFVPQTLGTNYDVPYALTPLTTLGVRDEVTVVSALVLTFEGGHGWNPENPPEPDAHSTENMGVLVAGHAGGLKAGRHIAGLARHPGQVVLSAMNAVGVPGDQFGEVKGNIPELFT
jgi:hypothetical protein